MVLARSMGFLAFGAFGLLSISNAHSGPNQGVNTAAEPQYLMFQIFTAGPGFTTEAGKQAISKLPAPGFLDVEFEENPRLRGCAWRRPPPPRGHSGAARA